MIIEENLKVRVRVFHKKNKKGEEKDYRMVFVTFPSKYTEVLKKYKELHDVELIISNERIKLPKVNLYVNGYYYNKKTGEKIPQYGFTIPVLIAERILEEGLKKIKVMVEIPEDKEEVRKILNELMVEKFKETK